MSKLPTPFHTRSRLIILSGLLLGLLWDPLAAALPNSVQKSAARRRAEAAREAAEETRERLEAAAQRAEMERARQQNEAAAAAAIAARAEAAAAEGAGAAEPDPAERQRLAAAESLLGAAKENLSSEGRELLSKPGQSSNLVNIGGGIILAQAPPSPDGGASQPTEPAAGGPRPQPLKPTPLEDPKLAQNKTVITCEGATFFDANKAIGIFTEDVKVYHPVFYLECEEMEVHMRKDDSAPKSAEKPAGEEGDEEEGSIDKVIARGPMVTIWKYTEEGDIQIGKCQEMVYDGRTGKVTLRKWPQVQRGVQVQIATEPGTVMTISSEGHFQSSGKSRTEILQGNEAEKRLKTLPRAPVFEP